MLRRNQKKTARPSLESAMHDLTVVCIAPEEAESAVSNTPISSLPFLLSGPLLPGRRVRPGLQSRAFMALSRKRRAKSN